MSEESVLIVGGGFAGVACAQQLAKHHVNVILLDRNNYHQFQPLLYQVATAQLAAYDIARPLRGIFRHHGGISRPGLAYTPRCSAAPETRSMPSSPGAGTTSAMIAP
jgi:NADH:ubiquinone reductase (H+-translocating)